MRLTVTIPDDIYEKLDYIAKKQHRPIGSVVVEACDIFINREPVQEAIRVAIESEQYEELIARLKKDLGLPQQHPE